MPTGAADIPEQSLHGIAAVFAAHAVVANAYHELIAELARDRDPRDAFELKAEVSHLNDKIVALDLSEIEHDQIILDDHPLHCTRQYLREAERQLGTIHLAEQAVVGERSEM